MSEALNSAMALNLRSPAREDRLIFLANPRTLAAPARDGPFLAAAAAPADLAAPPKPPKPPNPPSPPPAASFSCFAMKSSISLAFTSYLSSGISSGSIFGSKSCSVCLSSFLREVSFLLLSLICSIRPFFKSRSERSFLLNCILIPWILASRSTSCLLFLSTLVLSSSGAM